jgi:hypothetical protein
MNVSSSDVALVSTAGGGSICSASPAKNTRQEEGLHKAPEEKGVRQVHDGECKFASNLRAPQVANCPRNAVGVATGSLGKNFLATRDSCLTNLPVRFAPATACCCADNFPRAVERRRPRQDRRGGWSSRPSAPATSAGELSVSFPLRHEQKEQRVDHSRDPPSTEFTCPRSRQLVEVLGRQETPRMGPSREIP